jgi:hypothetical protein
MPTSLAKQGFDPRHNVVRAMSGNRLLGDTPARVPSATRRTWTLAKPIEDPYQPGKGRVGQLR